MKTVSYLGLFVALISVFSGLPPFWENFLLFVVGIVIFVKSYLFYKAGEKPKEKTSFKQNNHPEEKFVMKETKTMDDETNNNNQEEGSFEEGE